MKRMLVLAAKASLVMLGLTIGAAALAAPVPTWDAAVGGPGRFKVLKSFADQAVLDKETGLVWQKVISPLTVSFRGAVLACTELSVASRRGWRLPTAEELSSLMDVSQTNPPVAAGSPFENLVADVNTAYWTTTASPGLQGFRIGWTFADVGTVVEAPETTAIRAWCVRGGQNTVQ